MIAEVRKSILIIDDEAPIRKILMRACVRAGYAVHEAENGERALVVGQERPPDGIILDLDMPIMNGITFMNNIVDHHTLQMVPILILSNTADHILPIQTVLKGHVHYMVKANSSIHEVVKKVHQIV